MRWQLWNESQRKALIGLVGVFAIVLLVRAVLNSATIGDPPEATPLRASELADRLDPNTADWTELAALPGLGEKKARAIVETRQRLLAAHPGQIAFKDADDLQRVKGIGPSIASNLRPYLIFPGEQRPSTRP